MSRVRDAVSETGSSLATVFRNPGLRRINLAFAGSAIGDWAYATAIVVWAYGVGGVTAVGVWGTARLILMTLVTPFASTLVDRLPRKVVMVSTDLTRAVLVSSAALLIWVDAPAGHGLRGRHPGGARGHAVPAGRRRAHTSARRPPGGADGSQRGTEHDREPGVLRRARPSAESC